MKFTVTQIATLLDGEIIGDTDRVVETIAGIENGKKNSISFLSNSRYENHLYTTKSAVVLVNKDFIPKKETTATLVKVKNAYNSFSKLLEEYKKLLDFGKEGIEKPSHIGEKTTLGKGIYVGTFAYIGNNVKIGQNVKIYPHTYIGDDVTIGDNVILHAGVKIQRGTEVGNFCVIYSGAVIGSDGFGYAPQEDGTYRQIPQLGKVVLEDFVEIGANTTIDCATFDSTIISKGSKIDNLVQVAHNVFVGENTVIASQTGVAGSTKIGKQVKIAGQVGIAGHLKIGDRAILTSKSGISKSVPDNSVFYGYPATERSVYMKKEIAIRKLPEILQRLSELEKKM